MKILDDDAIGDEKGLEYQKHEDKENNEKSQNNEIYKTILCNKFKRIQLTLKSN